MNAFPLQRNDNLLDVPVIDLFHSGLQIPSAALDHPIPRVNRSVQAD